MSSLPSRRKGLCLRAHRVTAVFLVLAGLWYGGRAQGGQVVLVVTTNYYVVTGTNYSGLRASIMLNRPWRDTFAYDARTEWQARFSYSYRQRGGQQQGADFEVRTRVTVTLPRWIPPQPCDADLLRRWTQYFIGLMRHEQGHVRLAREASAEINRRLERLPAFPSARDLRATANSTFTNTLKEYQKKEQDYDRETQHGVTQGALFPHQRVTPTRVS